MSFLNQESWVDRVLFDWTRKTKLHAIIFDNRNSRYFSNQSSKAISSVCLIYCWVLGSRWRPWNRRRKHFLKRILPITRGYPRATTSTGGLLLGLLQDTALWDLQTLYKISQQYWKFGIDCRLTASHSG